MRKSTQLLNQLTLEEKISLIHGEAEPRETYQGQAGYLAGVPRLGIPSLRLADGPPGVLTRIPAAAPTSTMGLAATFSREDAEQNGILIAREAKARGIDVVLQPFINIDRDLTFNRAYNTFGEDPLLTGQIAASMVRGVQGQKILSQAKHYVAYDTDGTDVVVDLQTLHEIYVAPFADVSQAEVSSIMCSYNKINGEYACGNDATLNKILKQEVGFKGFVTSDWGATHGNTFINAGLDMEMPGPLGGPFGDFTPSYFDNSAPKPAKAPAPPPADAPDFNAMFNGRLPEEPPSKPFDFGGPPPGRAKNMRDALQEHQVDEATITRAAGRVLLQMDKFGFLDGQSHHAIAPDDVEANAKIIEKTGEDAAVLLKNEGHALPLSKEALSSLVLIGPGAGQTIAMGASGEKAVGLPERQIGPLTAMKKDTAGDGGSEHLVRRCE